MGVATLRMKILMLLVMKNVMLNVRIVLAVGLTWYHVSKNVLVMTLIAMRTVVVATLIMRILMLLVMMAVKVNAQIVLDAGRPKHHHHHHHQLMKNDELSHAEMILIYDNIIIHFK